MSQVSPDGECSKSWSRWPHTGPAPLDNDQQTDSIARHDRTKYYNSPTGRPSNLSALRVTQTAPAESAEQTERDREGRKMVSELSRAYRR